MVLYFFYSLDPAKLNEWYATHLGMHINQWGGCSLKGKVVNDAENAETTEWKPFEDGDPYFTPSEKPFMINFRVQYIEKLIDRLRENGVMILDEMETYDFGKFIHIMDPEGNKVELWEPASASL